MKPFWRNTEQRSGGILNNPAVPLSMAGFLTWAFGGEPTASGESVTPESGLQQATVYACIRVLGEAVASLTVRLYEETKTGRKERPDHPLEMLLRYAPNEHMSAFSFWDAQVGALNLRGNSYAEVQRDQHGRAVALWPLHPARTAPHFDSKGNLSYTTTDGEKDGRSRTIPAENMFHVPLFSVNGVLGLSPIELMRQNIGLAQAATKYGARWFGNGGKPPGILINKSPNLSPEQQKLVRQSWNETQGGENQGKTAVLTGDWSYQSIGIPPEDSQFLVTRQFQRTEIAAMYKVAPHMVGDTTKMSNNNAEQMNLSFVIDTLRPILMRYEQEIKRKLLVGEPQLLAEFDVRERLRGDFKSTMDGLAVGRQWGIMTANDSRRWLKMNSAGPVGDVLWSPVNMQNSERLLDTESIQDQPIGAGGNGTGTPAEPPPAPAEDKGEPDPKAKPNGKKRSVLAQYEQAYALVFRDAMGRLLNREKRDAEAVGAIMGPVVRAIAEAVTASSPQADPGEYAAAALKTLSARAQKFGHADVDGPDEFRRVVRSIYINVQRDLAAAAADMETA